MANRMKAADMPDETIVAGSVRSVVYIRNYPTARAQWRGTNGAYVTDRFIDDVLLAGGAVLRLGRG